MSDLSETQIKRYARHIVLKEMGGIGQRKLLDASVLVVGAGGLGSPLLLYLAAAGIGTIGIVDHDKVDLSNLQRQIIHATGAVGTPKVASAKAAIEALNPEIRVIAHEERLDAANALDLVQHYDIVADGSDNFDTRYLVNDACFFAKKTLVSAAILQFDGQLSTFKSHARGEHPCYRCLYAAPPPAHMAPSCSSAGVLGSLAGTLGSLQATEIVKELLGIGDSLSGQLLLYEALSATFRKLRFKRRADCPLCGDAPSILGLTARAA